MLFSVLIVCLVMLFVFDWLFSIRYDLSLFRYENNLKCIDGFM